MATLIPPETSFSMASRGFLDTITNEFDYGLTQRWWDKLLKDEAAMNKWLCKLWRTEDGGEKDNLKAIVDYKMEEGSRPYKIFAQTGKDENKHAGLLIDVLKGRGIEKPAGENPAESLYWNHMYHFLTDLQSCAAIFAVGEQLAAVRFKVIAAHPETPSDIKKGFLDVALPDETYHATAFASLADPEHMKMAYDQHQIAVNLLKGIAVPTGLALPNSGHTPQR